MNFLVIPLPLPDLLPDRYNKTIIRKITRDYLIIPDVMLRHENDRFLDDLTIDEVKNALNIDIVVASGDGKSFIDAITGKKEKN